MPHQYTRRQPSIEKLCERCGTPFKVEAWRLRRSAVRFCSRECRVLGYRNPHAAPHMSERFLANFWAKVNKNGPIPEHCPELGPCWVWTASTVEGGYGCIRSGGVLYRAPRVSYEIALGPIPDGLFVLHRCDNPPCVNPAHLFLGTAADNFEDAHAKGRDVPPDWRKRWRRET